jgi:hypothetical protein
VQKYGLVPDIKLTFEEVLITPVTRSGRSKVRTTFPKSENLLLYGVEIAAAENS